MIGYVKRGVIYDRAARPPARRRLREGKKRDGKEEAVEEEKGMGERKKAVVLGEEKKSYSLFPPNGEEEGVNRKKSFPHGLARQS